MTRNLAESFRRFAKLECENSSPLYETLSYQIAEDPDMLEIANHIPLGQPVPNLLFATVKYILKSTDDHLKRYYASFSNSPLPIAQAYPLFKAFVQKHEETLLQLFQTKLVQTNEVRRCAYLYPMFTEIYRKHGQPLALIEIGTSAGLQLGIDHYQYVYNDSVIVGNRKSTLLLSSENRGESLPESINTPPVISTRIGMDLNTIDVKNEAEYEWLQALIWPEHTERQATLDKAAAIIRQLELELLEGDAIEQIQTVCQKIPLDQIIVVFHTHVANQFPNDTKEKLLEILKLISNKRPLYHCYNNLYDANLHQDFLSQSEIISERILENTDGHARWFTWKNEI